MVATFWVLRVVLHAGRHVAMADGAGCGLAVFLGRDPRGPVRATVGSGGPLCVVENGRAGIATPDPPLACGTNPKPVSTQQ